MKIQHSLSLHFDQDYLSHNNNNNLIIINKDDVDADFQCDPGRKRPCDTGIRT
jgi:hypothetical protein